MNRLLCSIIVLARPQLTPSPGNFMPGDENGTIMKKSDPNERKALQELMSDTLKHFVPEFKKVIEKEGHGECSYDLACLY